MAEHPSANAPNKQPAIPTFRDGAGYIDDFVPPHRAEAPLEDQQRDVVRQAVEVHNSTVPDVGSQAEHSEEETLGNEELSEEEEEEFYDSLDEIDEGDFDVNDEDWEVADGDFTKQYNKLRTEGAIRTALIRGKDSSSSKLPSAPLPARNAARRAANITPRPHPGQHGPSTSSSSVTPAKSALSVPVSGVASAPKHSSRDANQKDKADRATVEQVLDPRTRKVLMSLIRRGLVSGVEGCVSTGKEANVYFGTPPLSPPVSASGSASYPDPYPTALALKIYKTSILSFKARGQYIQGEHRFRNSYSKVTNPRKMVRVWAEKELRNLRRLWEGGIRCPVVVDVRENVLVMEFLGTPEGGTSPRLKDAEIPDNQLADLYAELLIAMRRMYHRCRLIHADLSEYNILYHNEHLYIIDVSQSVEHDHPSAFDFLRADIRNVDDYFRKKSGGQVRTLGGRGTFEFVVGDKLKVWEGDVQEVVTNEDEENLVDVVRNWLAHGVGQQEEESQDQDTPGSSTQLEKQGQANVSDKVFMSSYIPRNLGEVYDPERDIDIIASGKGGDLIYAELTGLATDSKASNTGRETVSQSVAENGQSAENKGDKQVRWADDEDEEHSSSEEEDDDEDQRPRGFRHEDKDAKKERKKAIKEEKREKRQTKMPKAEKKRRIKTSGHK